MIDAFVALAFVGVVVIGAGIAGALLLIRFFPDCADEGDPDPDDPTDEHASPVPGLLHSRRAR